MEDLHDEPFVLQASGIDQSIPPWLLSLNAVRAAPTVAYYGNQKSHLAHSLGIPRIPKLDAATLHWDNMLQTKTFE